MENDTLQRKAKDVPKGMVEFTYGKDLGTREKDDKVVMHNSTAQALIAHGIGKVTKKIKVMRKDNN